MGNDVILFSDFKDLKKKLHVYRDGIKFSYWLLILWNTIVNKRVALENRETYIVTTIPFPFMNVTSRIRLFTGFVIT